MPAEQDAPPHERTTVAQIHQSAVVHPRAELGQDVVIGPFCCVEEGVIIGDGCRLEARSTIKSRTTLGKNNEIGEGSVIGGRAQHVHVNDPGGTLTMGDNNRVRENVTIHRGHANDAATMIGDNCMIMVNAHVGHDCRVGNNCILVNGSMLGGHVQVDDRAYVSGGVVVHQFCRVGRLAMVGGLARIVQDVPPYVMVEGGVTQIVGLNKVGLRRTGYSNDEILQLKQAYRVIYRQGLRWNEVLDVLKSDFGAGPAAAFYDFLKTGKRGFVQERRISRKATLKIVDPAHDEVEQAEAKRDAA